MREPGQYLECLLWKVRATAVLAQAAGAPARGRARGAPEPAPTRSAYFRETGLARGAELRRRVAAAKARASRARRIIREPTTTVVVYPGSSATVTALGNYLLELEDVRDREVAGEQVAAA